MSVPEYYGKPERILRFERGNFHGSQKPSPIGYEPCSYRMGMAVHLVQLVFETAVLIHFYRKHGRTIDYAKTLEEW